MRTIFFRLIGILEIAGGLYGVATEIDRLISPGPLHAAVWSLIALVVYGFVLVAGVLLLENSERGIRFSSIAQLMQLPLIGTPIFSYGLYCGAFINLFATLHLPPHPELTYHFGSQAFQLALAGPGVSRIGVNLLALLSWLILKLR